MAVLYLLLAFVVLFLVKHFADLTAFRRIMQFSKTLPGPDLKEFVANAKRELILKWLRSCTERFGPVFRVWMGKDLFVFFSDPEDVKTILGSNQLLWKSKNYKMLEAWLGKGLLTNGGQDWHRRRKMLTPGFHFKTLAEFKPQMEENCKILINKLDKVADGRQFDIYPYITLFALDIICETAMGIKKNAQLQSHSEYVNAVQTMCRVAHKQVFSMVNRIPIVFNNTTAGKERNEALKVLHGETWKTIALRRKMLEDCNWNINAVSNDDEDMGTKRRLAFLDILLIAQKEGADLTDTEIREEVDTFMFEGHDTTSSAIAFAIYMMALHPEEQQRAYEESMAMEGREKETMKYLEAVIKETLRLFPSVPLYGRCLQEDFEIRGMKIPKGTGVSVFTYMCQRNEKWFPNPDKFDPERFLDAEKELHPYAFVAFSAGPRNCIGQKFAMLELKCSLANILRNFEILPPENFEPLQLAEVIIKSANGVEVKLKKRNH